MPMHKKHTPSKPEMKMMAQKNMMKEKEMPKMMDDNKSRGLKLGVNKPAGGLKLGVNKPKGGLKLGERAKLTTNGVKSTKAGSPISKFKADPFALKKAAAKKVASVTPPGYKWIAYPGGSQELVPKK